MTTLACAWIIAAIIAVCSAWTLRQRGKRTSFYQLTQALERPQYEPSRLKPLVVHFWRAQEAACGTKRGPREAFIVALVALEEVVACWINCTPQLEQELLLDGEATIMAS